MNQLERLDLFRRHTTVMEADGGQDRAEERDIPQVSLATKDVAAMDVVTDLLTAED